MRIGRHFFYNPVGNRTHANPVRVAHPFSPFNGPLDGTLDEVRLYDRALSGPEIMTLTQARDYSYDAKGNLTSDRVWGYAYDHENRLTGATNGALRIDYRYDAFGRLIERRTSGSAVTTNRMYYAGWQLIAEYNGAGALQRKYVYGPGIDEPVRMRFTGGVGTNYYYHADGLGSVTEITTTTGTKTESYTYDVYGTPTIYNASPIPISQSAIGNRLLFTCRDRDPDTALYNYRYRYYSPSLGRFVQPDPVGLASGDLNLYRYVANSPASAVDPFGLVDINLLNLSSEEYQLMEAIPTPDDELSVGAHGSQMQLLGPSGSPLADSELAEIIRKHPKWKSGRILRIRIYSCSAGKITNPRRPRNVAKKLSMDLRVKTIAPATELFLYNVAND